MALIPCQVLRVAILLSYLSVLCHYKAIEMPAHQTYGGSWKFLTFIDLYTKLKPGGTLVGTNFAMSRTKLGKVERLHLKKKPMFTQQLIFLKGVMDLRPTSDNLEDAQEVDSDTTQLEEPEPQSTSSSVSPHIPTEGAFQPSPTTRVASSPSHCSRVSAACAAV
ncbi:androgen-induced gene 1 protein isoform X3 [Rhinoderma darwinii]|uniref:androgen-induced gene 1 protein isoform X3 n=1 Tax=Rhinoderma darwinii TaxID=43563 RepID=UPI003F6747E3